MKVYQMHPDHGRHIAYDSNEEQRNIENGWATVTEDEFYAEMRNKQKESKESGRDELVDAYIDKFGKKPHHAMKSETIQAKLDE